MSNTSKISGLRVFVILVMSLLGIAVIGFTVFSVLSPLKELSETEEAYAGAASDSTGTPCKYDASLRDKVEKQAYLEAYQTMAKGDSMGLFLNLSQEIIGIQYKGVVLQSTKIDKYYVSKFFDALSPCTYEKLFSAPVEITSQWASVEKEPIVVKNAPKDTIEALEMAKAKPDTIIHEQVNVILTLARGYKVLIREASPEEESKADFTFKEQMNHRLEDAKRLMKFKKPEYTPTIIIFINKKDAISIYRALPQKAMAVIQV